MVSQELGSDIGQNPTPGSLQINLLFTIYAEQASGRSRCKLCFSSKDTLPIKTIQSRHHRFGGAERDRTADPLLAKQVLSQLSYSPISSISLVPQNKSSANFRARSIIPDPHSIKGMVGLGRLELPTPRLSSVCSNQLSYRPILVKPARITPGRRGSCLFEERETWTAQFAIPIRLPKQFRGVLRFDGHLTGAIYVLKSTGRFILV